MRITFRLTCSHAVIIDGGLSDIARSSMICGQCGIMDKVVAATTNRRNDPTNFLESRLVGTLTQSSCEVPTREVTDMDFQIGEPESGEVGRRIGQPIDPDLLALIDRLIALPAGKVLPVTLPVARSSAEYQTFGRELERAAHSRRYKVRRSASEEKPGVLTVRLAVTPIPDKSVPAVKSEAVKPEAVKPEAVKSEAVKSEAVKPVTAGKPSAGKSVSAVK